MVDIIMVVIVALLTLSMVGLGSWSGRVTEDGGDNT